MHERDRWTACDKAHGSLLFIWRLHGRSIWRKQEASLGGGGNWEAGESPRRGFSERTCRPRVGTDAGHRQESAVKPTAKRAVPMACGTEQRHVRNMVFAVSAKMMCKQPHRSQRRLSPEFGKIDAQAKTLSRRRKPASIICSLYKASLSPDRCLFFGAKPDRSASRGSRTQTSRLGCRPPPRVAGTAVCRARWSSRVSALPQLG